MLGRGLQDRIKRTGLTAGLALCVAFLSSGCISTPYAGVLQKLNEADPELRSLVQRAQAGNKYAQLELGIRYEEGRGVVVSLAKAKSLYELAATDSKTTRQIYMPSTNKASGGQVISPGIGFKVTGLTEAKTRLARIQHYKSRFLQARSLNSAR